MSFYLVNYHPRGTFRIMAQVSVIRGSAPMSVRLVPIHHDVGDAVDVVAPNLCLVSTSGGVRPPAS